MPRSSPHLSGQSAAGSARGSLLASAQAGADRTSLYQEITAGIIADLEAGRLPWVQPSGTSAVHAPLTMPRNAATGRRYSGVNVLILWGAVVQQGRSGQSWLTFRQVLSLGATSARARAARPWCSRTVSPPTPNVIERANRATTCAIPFLKRFTVFNADQCDGLPDEATILAPPPPKGMILPEVEALIRASGADLRIGGDRACCDVPGDVVRAPPPQAYFESVNWHRTALHELGRWSGAASRLDRDLSGGFGSKNYAKEELVAEMTTAFACASLGIAPTVRHADYIGSWLDVLRETTASFSELGV